MSTGCSEVEGLMMKRRGEGLLSPPFSLHTPVWAWLSQSARYKVALTCRQPWGGAGLAWHTQTGRAQGGSQVSSSGQVRARSPGTAPGQKPRLLTTLGCRALLPMPARKVEAEEPHKIVYLNLFCFTEEKLRPRARRHLPGARRRTESALFSPQYWASRVSG